MTDPKVTFIVPCYNLSHLLTECVTSILAQTYRDFELLIMDDCSPDNTPAVAASFVDPRIRHIRNEVNLGNLANFNKGISLARGKYIWLISADDCLRSIHVLDSYVELMEQHPEVGFVCCPAVKLENGQEAEVLKFSCLEPQDAIIKGTKFLEKLIESNTIVAPCVMARKECYEKVNNFPLDLPHSGDWYMWCIFTMYYDLAYFSEPMVYYRYHSQSLTNILKNQNEDILFFNNIEVLTRIRHEARLKGQEAIMLKCNDCLVTKYINRLLFNNGDLIKSSVKIAEELLSQCHLEPHERKQFNVRIYEKMADIYYSYGEMDEASTFYMTSLRVNWRLPRIWLKYIFLKLGNVGVNIRTTLASIRRRVWHVRPPS